MRKKTSKNHQKLIYSIFIFNILESKLRFDMSKKFELRWVDDEVWKETPTDIQEKKIRFGVLQHFIKIRKRRIERLKKKIKELQLERSDWEKERTVLYHDLISFQKQYIPSVSPTVQPSNNFQWSINLTIGILKRKKYLGSNENVRKRLDEIKDIDIFSKKKDDMRNDLTKECREEIRKIIQKNIVKEMENDFDGVTKKWENDELKMWDYFY